MSKESVAVEIETGVLGSFLFMMLKISNLAQGAFANVFWFVFIKPTLAFSKFVNVEKNIPHNQRRNGESKTFVVFDTTLKVHRWLWECLKCLFDINAMLSGHVNRFDTYSKLVRWNQRIPLRGYLQDKTTFTIELLTGPDSDGLGRPCDFSLLSINKYHGTFQITSKTVEQVYDRREIVVKCVWTSGQDIGGVFEIKRHGDLKNANPEVPVPNSIYYPPRFLVFALELLLSASALLAFLDLVQGGWVLVRDPFNHIVKQFSDWITPLIPF